MAHTMKLRKGRAGAVMNGLLRLLVKARPKLEKPGSQGRGRTFLSKRDRPVDSRHSWGILSNSFKKVDPVLINVFLSRLKLDVQFPCHKEVLKLLTDLRKLGGVGHESILEASELGDALTSGIEQ